MRHEASLKNAGLRPWPLRLANRILPSPSSRSFSVDRILRAAESKAGTKVGQDFDAGPLRVLTNAIIHEARLSPLGGMIMRRRLVDALATRLRANLFFQRHPEILEQPVAPIWLITGLQRTGTTFLQRILSADPEARALLSWESLDPVPHGTRDEYKRRMKKARMSERALAWMAPSFFAIHPIAHARPEEDVLLLDPTFLTTAAEATMHVPSFGNWLESQDHTKAYRWEKKMLQLLQWQRPAGRWVLKSPHHLEFLPAFLHVFPDTKIIWTHRDPCHCLPSFLSMIYHGRAIFSTDVRTTEVRNHWLRKCARMVSNGMDFRNSNSDVPIVDVQFDQLVSDPIHILQTVYSAFDEPMNENQRQTLEATIRQESTVERGEHKYDSAQFGLQDEEMQKSFKDYLQFLTDVMTND